MRIVPASRAESRLPNPKSEGTIPGFGEGASHPVTEFVTAPPSVC